MFATEDAPPPPDDEPQAKRPRVDPGTGLQTEEYFLEENPGPVEVCFFFFCRPRALNAGRPRHGFIYTVLNGNYPTRLDFCSLFFSFFPSLPPISSSTLLYLPSITMTS